MLEHFADDAGVASFVFQRHVKPDWNVRVTIDGAPEVHLRFRERVTSLLSTRAADVPLRRFDLGEAPPAAPEESGDGARLLHEDGRACLAFLACERSGRTSRNRREYSLLLVERLLDLFGFDREKRLKFYRLEAGEPFALGTWGDAAREKLETRYQGLRKDVSRFLVASDWGGAEPTRIATALLDASRPMIERLREADRDRTLGAPLVPLVVAIARRHGNRLGIHGLGQAAMRFFMMRLHEEERIPCP